MQTGQCMADYATQSSLPEGEPPSSLLADDATSVIGTLVDALTAINLFNATLARIQGVDGDAAIREAHARISAETRRAAQCVNRLRQLVRD